MTTEFPITQPSTTPESPALGLEASVPSKSPWLQRNVELILAIFLGIVSVITAYASFQSALYDSSMSGNYTEGQALITEANSLYLSGSQQYAQDLQIWNRLNELAIDMDSKDPELAEAAQFKFDTIFTNSVSQDLSDAIAWSDRENTANPDGFVSPVDSEDYIASIFSEAQETEAKGYAAIEQGNLDNNLSDRMTLNTVLYAIVLFMLGIAAVVREHRVKLLLGGVSGVIFIVSLVLTVMIPFKGL